MRVGIPVDGAGNRSALGAPYSELKRASILSTLPHQASLCEELWGLFFGGYSDYGGLIAGTGDRGCSAGCRMGCGLEMMVL